MCVYTECLNQGARCVLVLSSSQWLGAASTPPTSHPLAAHFPLPVGVCLSNNLAPSSAERFSDLTPRPPVVQHTIHRMPGRVRIKGLATAASWRSDSELLAGCICCCCLRESSWGYCCTWDFEESEWKRIMCLHDPWGKCRGKVLHTHSSVQWLCSLTLWPLGCTSHFPSVLCALSNKLLEPLCFR